MLLTKKNIEKHVEKQKTKKLKKRVHHVFLMDLECIHYFKTISQR